MRANPAAPAEASEGYGSQRRSCGADACCLKVLQESGEADQGAGQDYARDAPARRGFAANDADGPAANPGAALD